MEFQEGNHVRMDAEKKRKLDAQLRQLMMKADLSDENPTPVAEKKPVVVRVIRRRKGVPDRQIA
jgi:hypothetical protein